MNLKEALSRISDLEDLIRDMDHQLGLAEGVGLMWLYNAGAKEVSPHYYVLKSVLEQSSERENTIDFEALVRKLMFFEVSSNSAIAHFPTFKEQHLEFSQQEREYLEELQLEADKSGGKYHPR